MLCTVKERWRHYGTFKVASIDPLESLKLDLITSSRDIANDGF